MKRPLILFFVFCTSLGFAQNLLDSTALATAETFTSLTEALAKPDSVFRLSLKKQKLKRIPAGVYKLKNLQWLDLSRNKLSTLNDSILLLTKLQYLNASNNELQSLPEKIGVLKELRELNVNQNEIQSIPDSFGDLENLQVADLWSNELSYIPESIEKLKNLRWMDLRNILIPQEKQDHLSESLPNTKIYFSPACKCAW